MNEFLFVVVLYEISMSQSLTVRTLTKHRGNFQQQGIHLLVIDNTPTAKPESFAVDGEIEYTSFGENRGLANAYQTAFLMAKARKFRFLVLFDQDSEVNEDFISALDEVAKERGSSVAIWCPDVICDGTPISPYSLNSFGWPNFYPKRESKGLYGINSFSVVNVRFVEIIGGFEQFYWLDCLDTWLYEQANSEGWYIQRLSASVKHNLSLVSGRISPSRMQNIAFYESSMVLEYGTGRRILGTILRLILRGIKHLKIMGGFRIYRCYLKEIINGARAGLKRRSRKASRSTCNYDSPLLRPRPRISVCMAAFNGGKYIEAQLQSILSQLDARDEVVIVDDCSTDDTLARIRGMQDGRIRLIQHTLNLGVVATFEDALLGATGEILFLSDDDDVWAPNKVGRFLEAFNANPDADIVTSRVQLIDHEDNLFSNDQITRDGKFFSGFWRNVFKNQYQGSAMAIRASLLRRVLPFPVKPLFLHDVWIGTRNAITGGKTAFIEENLLFYRRHSKNFSRRLSRWKQLRVRVELLWAHFIYLLRFKSPG